MIEEPVNAASLSIIAVATAIACGPGVATPTPAETVGAAGSRQEVALGDTFSLDVGEIEAIAGEPFSVRFVQVEEDSRCPLDTTCVWAGDGVVTLELSSGAGTVTTDLHTNPDFSQSATYAQYSVQLLDLEPQRTADQPIGPADYVAILVVTRGK